MELRDAKQAVEYAKRSAEKSGGKNGEILELLARAYSASGDPSRAMEIEKKALQLAPADEAGLPDRRRITAQIAKLRAAASHP